MNSFWSEKSFVFGYKVKKICFDSIFGNILFTEKWFLKKKKKKKNLPGYSEGHFKWFSLLLKMI